ncbi:MAG: arylamine N-acetyltransferase [Acidobacteria bacterium]|nr:arylamine N-acetyltransferase [Acidobacteriota bacterium]
MRPLAPLNRRYLSLLGPGAPPTGLDGLRLLVRQHLCRVPFENVSKLLLYGREGQGRAIGLGEFLDGIEFHDLGGTCYSANPFFARLLRALGYEATLLGADMSAPDVHTAIRVLVEGRAYHVDVGYGTPFYAPIPLEGLPWSVRGGRHRWVLQPGPLPSTYRMTEFEGIHPVHGYLVHGPSRTRRYFDRTIQESFEPGRTFMSCLRITRFFATHHCDLRNDTLLQVRGSRVKKTRLATRQELREVVHGLLGMPRCPIDEAVDVLENLTGRRLFGAPPAWSPDSPEMETPPAFLPVPLARPARRGQP